MRGENLSNEDMRYAFNNHDFKAGNVPVSDDNFVRNLGKGKPESYPEFSYRSFNLSSASINSPFLFLFQPTT